MVEFVAEESRQEIWWIWSWDNCFSLSTTYLRFHTHIFYKQRIGVDLMTLSDNGFTHSLKDFSFGHPNLIWTISWTTSRIDKKNHYTILFTKNVFTNVTNYKILSVNVSLTWPDLKNSETHKIFLTLKISLLKNISSFFQCN